MICAAEKLHHTTAAGTSIAGGFVLVSAAGLVAAWRACRSGPLGIADFRAWLACREMVARRCRPEQGRPPAYSSAELAGLLGIAEKRARASINRLAAAGLLQWSDHAMGFPEPTAGLDHGLEDSIGQGRGSLAIPRRILRHLADGARPALIATALGLLLRCLSRRRGGFAGRGRAKSAWIARTFDVDLRRVKQARRELVELRWIDPEPSAPDVEKRWGRAFTIDLAWDRPARAEGRSLPPVPPPGRPAIATPTVDQDPFQEKNQYQEPAPGGPAGARLEEIGGGDATPSGPGVGTTPEATTVGADPAPRGGPPASPAATSGTSDCPSRSGRPGPPRLRDVRVEDLRDTGRVLELFAEATALGWVGPSEADRLRFVGAAEHALAIGEGNPAGLFVHLVRAKLWRHLTQEEEDRANRRIKAFLRGREGPRMAPVFPLGFAGPATASSSRPPARPALSEDARTVIRVRSASASAGYRGDPFPQVRRHDPSWTRERWDRALAELSPS